MPRRSLVDRLIAEQPTALELLRKAVRSINKHITNEELNKLTEQDLGKIVREFRMRCEHDEGFYTVSLDSDDFMDQLAHTPSINARNNQEFFFCMKCGARFQLSREDGHDYSKRALMTEFNLNPIKLNYRIVHKYKTGEQYLVYDAILEDYGFEASFRIEYQLLEDDLGVIDKNVYYGSFKYKKEI